MADITWWMEIAAEEICGHCVEYDDCGKGNHERQFASIIAAHAEPLVALLRESRRDHHHACMAYTDGGRHKPEGDCTMDCDVGNWNARVDSALAGLATEGSDAESTAKR